MTSLAFAAAALVTLGACNADKASTNGTATDRVSATPVAPPASGDWSSVVTKTPEGGFAMGNPNAKVKLIEFGSLTCHVCADFSQNSEEKIKAEFVDSGQVAYEFRNYLRNPLDGLAAAAMHCAGKDRFYPIMTNIYASQEELFAGAGNMEQAAQQMQSEPDNRKFITYAKGVGLYDFFKARGMSEEQLDQCYGDPANVLAVQDRSNAAGKKFDIQGTPTFVLNGEPFSLVGGVDPVITVSEKLRAAGAR